MLKTIRQFLAARQAQPNPSVVPPGERVYAIGDVHGRLDLLCALATAIDTDDTTRGKAETTIVLLGDLVDRGPDSAGVLSMVRDWHKRCNLRLLCGNHEEMFRRSFADLGVFRRFLLFGGRETILSYPVDEAAFTEAEMAEAQQMMIDAVPRSDMEFIESFEDFVVIGDYLFVHAGIRPGSPPEMQNVADLRWIREPFLSHSGQHEHIVVHGHTITEEPVFTANRIGIDTGAFMSGRLTALALEGDERWLIEAEELDGKLTVTTRAA